MAECDGSLRLQSEVEGLLVELKASLGADVGDRLLDAHKQRVGAARGDNNYLGGKEGKAKPKAASSESPAASEHRPPSPASKSNMRETGTSHGSSTKRSMSCWHAGDSYAFAVILWEIMTLRKPFADACVVQDIWAKVRSGGRPCYTQEEADGAPGGYVQLTEALWSQDPAERPTFAEALEQLNGMRVPHVPLCIVRNIRRFED